MRRWVAACTVGLALAAPARADEVIDRVLAVVNTQIITLSDARAAVLFGFLTPAANEDRTHAAMEYLIERQLMLAEVQRYLPAEPPAERVEARLALVRRRFPTPQAYQRALEVTGLTEEEVRAHARDELRIAAYIDDRFASAMQPSDEEVFAYARAHRVELAATAPSPDAQIDLARVRLAAERREARVTEWVAGLRRRADITELYLPAPSTPGSR